MGNATLTAPEGTKRFDILEKLGDKAKEEGADAVAILRYKILETGKYIVPDPPKSSADPGNIDADGSDESPDGALRYSDTWGDNVSDTERHVVHEYEILVQAIFLKKIKEFEEYDPKQNE
jgi:hypothetical protein